MEFWLGSELSAPGHGDGARARAWENEMAVVKAGGGRAPPGGAGGPAAGPGRNVAGTPRAELAPSSKDLAAHLAHGSGRLLGDGWCVTRAPSRQPLCQQLKRASAAAPF